MPSRRRTGVARRSGGVSPVENAAATTAEGGLMRHEVVFLFDVDNTLLDNDRVSADLKRHLQNKVGTERQGRYWSLFEELRRFPAQHYVLVDDKLRILTAVKSAWRARVTTVFPRQGHYALDPKVLSRYPPADVTIERIGGLLDIDLPAHFGATPARSLIA